ncbi:MAG: hypothetical protein ACETVZ_01695, partial [Phycisphaerae bacterium]
YRPARRTLWAGGRVYFIETFFGFSGYGWLPPLWHASCFGEALRRDEPRNGGRNCKVRKI